jgi:hypothetical protein
MTYREYRLLIRTVADIFRMVPYSFFILIPGLEAVLPLYMYLFPNMLPTSFRTHLQKVCAQCFIVTIDNLLGRVLAEALTCENWTCKVFARYCQEYKERRRRKGFRIIYCQGKDDGFSVDSIDTYNVLL